MRILETLAGLLTLILSIPVLLVVMIVGLFDLPRYFRIRGM